MYVPIPVLVAAAILILVLVVLAFRRRTASRDLIEPPRATFVPRPQVEGHVGSSGLPPEVDQEVRLLLSQDRKIEAIKRVREATHMGLAEAKNLVERL